MSKARAVIRRSDGNTADLVKAARSRGCVMQDIHIIGDGCPDQIAGIAGWFNALIEIKNGANGLNADEEIWHQLWTGQKAICRTPADMTDLIELIKRATTENWRIQTLIESLYTFEVSRRGR